MIQVRRGLDACGIYKVWGVLSSEEAPRLATAHLINKLTHHSELIQCWLADAGQDGTGDSKEGTGMGDGSTAGAKDVSDELENEDQLLGNKQEQKENNEDEPPEDGDAKGKLTDAAVKGNMAFVATRLACGVECDLIYTFITFVSQEWK